MARGWVYRHGGGLYGGEATGWVPVNSKHPCALPPFPPGTVGCHVRQQWLKCNLPLKASPYPDHTSLPTLQQHVDGPATAPPTHRSETFRSSTGSQ